MELKLPSKADLVDNMGRPITQSLFLEIGYSDFSVFTLKDDHYVYNGRLMPSLKKLFIEHEDPTEYDFADTYLLGWRHWRRMNENKVLRKHFDEWREELELRLRSKAVRQTIKQAEEGNFSASKWLADRGWEKRGAGRPSKDEVRKQSEIQKRISDEYGADIVRLFNE